MLKLMRDFRCRTKLRHGVRFTATIIHVDSENKTVAIKLDPRDQRRSKHGRPSIKILNWESIQEDLDASFFILCLREILIGHKDLNQIPSIATHSLITLSQVSEQVIENYRNNATKIPQIEEVISSVKPITKYQIHKNAIKDGQLVKILNVPDVLTREIANCLDLHEHHECKIFQVEFKHNSMITHLNTLTKLRQRVQIPALGDFEDCSEESE